MLQKDFHKGHVLRNEMIHFINNLQYYMMFEVIESAWQDLEADMAKAEDLDQLIVAHQVKPWLALWLFDSVWLSGSLSGSLAVSVWLFDSVWLSVSGSVSDSLSLALCLIGCLFGCLSS